MAHVLINLPESSQLRAISPGNYLPESALPALASKRGVDELIRLLSLIIMFFCNEDNTCYD
jgi:hypothetical protein